MGISRLIIATAAFVGMFAVVLIYGANENNRMARFDANFQGRAIEAGADIYKQACASCHGENGEGLVGPALNAADLLIPEPGQTKPPRLIANAWAGDLRSYLEGPITYGRVGTVMPAWGQAAGGPYRADQVSALASFIMNWSLDPGKAWGGAVERTALGGVQPVQTTASRPLGAAPPLDVRSAALGRYLFEGPLGCANCHIFNGTVGMTGPELTNVISGKGRDYVYESIINPNFFASEGHAPGAMPETFGFSLTEIELQSIIDYLETPGAAPAVVDDSAPAEQTEPLGPENGMALATANGCVACHSIDGSVVVGPSWLGAFGRNETLDDGSTVTVDAEYLYNSIVNPGSQIVAGFSNVMPANYGDTLTDAEIADIISYIESLQ